MYTNLESEINNKISELEKTLNSSNSLNEVQSAKDEYLKKYVKSLYSELKKIDNPEEKKKLGKAINDFKNHCENVINTYIEKFKNSKNVSKYDYTVFKNSIKIGSGHPLIKLYKKIEKVFVGMGFSVVQVADWLGHSSSATTLNFYAHAEKRSKMDIANALDNCFQTQSVR